MPCGINLKSTIARRSNATSPIVGPTTNATIPLTAPKRIEAEAVPASIAVPPEITVMNALPI